MIWKLLESGSGVIGGQKLQNDFFLSDRTGIIWQMEISDPITLIKKSQEIQSAKLQLWIPTSGERFETGSEWIIPHTNEISVRNQSNGFVEHSAKFWRSIFWTITWNVWPSDISVGTSWILCIQGNVPSIYFQWFFPKLEIPMKF